MSGVSFISDDPVILSAMNCYSDRNRGEFIDYFHVPLAPLRELGFNNISVVDNFFYDSEFGFLSLRKCSIGLHESLARILLEVQQGYGRFDDVQRDPITQWLKHGDRAYMSTLTYAPILCHNVPKALRISFYQMFGRSIEVIDEVF